ncbi:MULTISPECIES: flagellar hook-associated protein FlgL [unclassified Shewanella]|uniref:flagellar hook-associated protein FlgL n=1 Tax=unclassified Shewanella TaxID=196818 RepID=UPI002003D9CE|nr:MULTISPECIES: flagellar hook-associated protein FlgL [unclassified Shewanella]MCK7634417.1 flagellar hook-associated protein FlgL [Shewanella sp. JNE17]MCK7649583.1 flagellar hook-associated protein FlgL [Shewanella sp. JNE8]MCK7657846.1 flagellar hook-associated protein FlgL [Shewanella sp. JNE4-2]UPO30057.1 flagellar hook-associated protein FlgL [Shewanella sp. JNE2]
MRLSSAQIFNQSITSVLQKQTATSKILEQLSSGKKVNTAGDDPVAALGIDNLNQRNALVDQFMKNIDYATNHLQHTESQLGQADKLVSSMKDMILRGSNGSMTSTERQTIADELQKSLDQLLAIANTKDESGNYLFAGNHTDKLPFQFDTNGQIVYQGDSGVRTSIIASGVQLNTNVPGDTAFTKSPNAMGDYSVKYLPSQQGDFSVSSAKIANATPSLSGYTVSFLDDGVGGVNVEVTDNALPPNIITPAAPFDPTVPVTFDGVELKITGEPKIGDSFILNEESEISIFDTFSQAIKLLGNADQIQTPAGQSELAQLLNNIESGVKQISQQQGLAGNSLKTLEKYTDKHTDEKLINASALSKLEDLDYATAITEFEKQQLALNAVASVFSKVGSVSLFDYI